MTTKVAWLLSLLALALPAFAVPSGSISGTVKSADGTPQMGAVVEIFAAGSVDPLLLYTDNAGRYTAGNILPGFYDVKVSAAAFLPSLRKAVLKGINRLTDYLDIIGSHPSFPQKCPCRFWSRELGSRLAG